MSKPMAAEFSSGEDFSQLFQQEQAALDKQIDWLKDASLSEIERANLIDQCLAGVASLSDKVRDASIYTLAYDQRTYAAAIKNLGQRLQTLRAPRRKFTFNKSKSDANPTTSNSDAPRSEATSQQQSRRFPKPSTEPSSGKENTLLDSSAPSTNTIPYVTPSSASTATIPPTTPHSPTSSATSSPTTTISTTITSQSPAHLIPSPTFIPPSSPLSLAEIHNSLIDLSPIPYPLAALTITSTTNSLVICAPVAGAAHITNVKSSVLLISARQVRMHECSDCIFYLNCTSQPIIEDCKGMKFAPLPPDLLVQKSTSSSSPSHDDKSSTTTTTSSASNKWAQVADFKWLKVEHSPNWSILPVEERVDDKIWKNIVAVTCSAESEAEAEVEGGQKRSGEGLREVLRRVGVRGLE